MNCNVQSNTKLTQDQKTFLKELKAKLPNVKVRNNGYTTIAYMDRGNTVEFAVSVAAPNEIKFRRKVGEYYAILRFNYKVTVKMDRKDFYHMMETTLRIF